MTPSLNRRYIHNSCSIESNNLKHSMVQLQNSTCCGVKVLRTSSAQTRHSALLAGGPFFRSARCCELRSSLVRPYEENLVCTLSNCRCVFSLAGRFDRSILGILRSSCHLIVPSNDCTSWTGKSCGLVYRPSSGSKC